MIFTLQTEMLCASVHSINVNVVTNFELLIHTGDDKGIVCNAPLPC